jgi:hypothetical protein
MRLDLGKSTFSASNKQALWSWQTADAVYQVIATDADLRKPRF